MTVEQAVIPVAVVIPAKDEAERIAATVAAVSGLPGVDLVVVVDDASTDDTGGRARAAGAHVVRHRINLGKSAALTSGVDHIATHDVPGAPHLLLFVDADLGDSAANLAPLIEPVAAGHVDMTVANMPAANSSQGGGRVVRLAQRSILDLTGQIVNQPLNGMRCLTREAFGAARPLAPGWGVEVGLLLDILGAGLRVREVSVDFTHRASGRDLRGALHRGKQFRDVARVVANRRVRALSDRPHRGGSGHG